MKPANRQRGRSIAEQTFRLARPATSATRAAEITWHKNHKYLTLVYDTGVGSKRLLDIAKDRTEESLSGFFAVLGQAHGQKLLYVCSSDMWVPLCRLRITQSPAPLGLRPRLPA